MTKLKQISRTSLLIPYEQLYIQAHYYRKELLRVKTTECTDPHITSPPAIHTDQYFNATTS